MAETGAIRRKVFEAYTNLESKMPAFNRSARASINHNLGRFALTVPGIYLSGWHDTGDADAS
jgi:hypothetical protein